MDYQFITEENKQEAVTNRLAQLESEHLSNSFFLEEAQMLGSGEEVQKYTAILRGLELRIDAYREKLQDESTAE